MSPFVIILLSLCALIAIFLVAHFRALTQDEIASLATKRRNKAITVYYSHQQVRYTANPDAKKSMPPTGGLIRIEYALSETPPVLASLLKYKKHEWIMIAFEKDKKVDLVWMNKGHDRTSVGSLISIDRVKQLCAESGYNSVLIFHNHPNSNPNHYRVDLPSQTDLQSAKSWAQSLNADGINLVEYICDRGTPIKYYISIRDSFLPFNSFYTQIQVDNGASWNRNLSLHIERMFS